MCDESFSLNAKITIPSNLCKSYVYFYITAFNYFSWVLVAGLDGLLGGIIQLKLSGIDFVMTSLFIVLFVEQLTNSRSKWNAFIGILTAIVCLIFCGQDLFLIIALVVLVGIFSLNYFRKAGRSLN